MANSPKTMEIVRRYHASWTTKDFSSAAELLSPALAVEVPVNQYPTKESFVAALAGFGSTVQRTQLLGEFENGNQAMLLYDLHVDALGKFRVAEHFTVDGGFIVKIRQVHDTYAVRKSGFARFGARAVADAAEGSLLATVDLSASPARVFHALTSTEVTRWWVRHGVFDTREWSGEIRVRGRWRASGMARGRPYVLEGEFLEVDSPHKLVHTWRIVGAPGEPSSVAYLLESIHGGTRLTLRQSGLSSPEQCVNTAIGWETSFDRLSEIIDAENTLGP